MTDLLIIGAIIAVLYGAYCLFKALLAAPQSEGKISGGGADGRAAQPQTAEESARRAAALTQFQNVHAAARDARKQVARAVEDDPARAAQVLSKIMKNRN